MEGLDGPACAKDPPDWESPKILTSVKEIVTADTATPPPPILRLPPELLQLILRHVNAETLFIALLTCKQLRATATSKPLLLYHLGQLPGVRLGLGELEPEGLLQCFQSRAAENACAAAVLSDATHYQAGNGSLTPRSAMTAMRAWPQSKYPVLAIPFASGTIQLYEATKTLLRKRETLHPHREDGNPGPVQILKLAFSEPGKDLAVICRQDPNPDADQGTTMLRWQSDRGTVSIIYKLVVFHHLRSEQKGHFYTSSQQETRDIVLWEHYKIVALALATNGTACIVCQTEPNLNGPLVWLIHRNNELMSSTSYDPAPRLTPVVSPSDPMHRLVYSARFSHTTSISLFAARQSIPSWQTDLPESDTSSVRRPLPEVSIVDIDKDGSDMVGRRGEAFLSSHVPEVHLPGVDGALCRWTNFYLMLFNPTGDPVSSQSSLFIMSDEHFKDAATCDHVSNLAIRSVTGHRQKPVALLAGFREGRSSLGTLMAISHEGTRIASAVWNHVYIWTFNPKLLSESDLSVYFPPADYNARKGFGRLRPILLTSDVGVVHSMLWATENVLYIVTDRGVSKFDIGNHCCGVREDCSLYWDTWYTTALTERAPGSGPAICPATLDDYSGAD